MVHVRPATRQDAAAWLRLRRALWPDEHGSHAREISEYFDGRLRMPLAVLLAVDGAGNAVGFAELSIRAYAEGCETDRVAYLEGWYVEPDARRRGIGRALVAAAERWAMAQGCTEFASDALIDNDVSGAAHRALGFEEIERIRVFRKVLSHASAERPPEAAPPGVDIRPIEPRDAAACAEFMVTSEPWLTLGVSRDTVMALLADPAKEMYATRDAAGVSGFIVIDMRGLVRGYIQVLCVRPDRRGQGLGTALVRWAEERIFRDSPNAFICVSSFNDGAYRLYERLGFERVGLFPNFIVPGFDELLLRKTRGPWSEFRRR